MRYWNNKDGSTRHIELRFPPYQFWGLLSILIIVVSLPQCWSVEPQYNEEVYGLCVCIFLFLGLTRTYVRNNRGDNNGL